MRGICDGGGGDGGGGEGGGGEGDGGGGLGDGGGGDGDGGGGKGGGGEGKGGEGGGGEGATTTLTKTMGRSTLSTVTPAARDRAEVFLARACTEATMLVASPTT